MAKRIELTNCNLPAKERALQARSGYNFINHLQAGRDERKPKIPDRKGTRTITKNAKNLIPTGSNVTFLLLALNMKPELSFSGPPV